MANETSYICEMVREGKTVDRSGHVICNEVCPYNNQQALTWEGETSKVCKTEGIVSSGILIGLEKITC